MFIFVYLFLFNVISGCLVLFSYSAFNLFLFVYFCLLTHCLFVYFCLLISVYLFLFKVYFCLFISVYLFISGCLFISCSFPTLSLCFSVCLVMFTKPLFTSINLCLFNSVYLPLFICYLLLFVSVY